MIRIKFRLGRDEITFRHKWVESCTATRAAKRLHDALLTEISHYTDEAKIRPINDALITLETLSPYFQALDGIEAGLPERTPQDSDLGNTQQLTEIPAESFENTPPNTWDRRISIFLRKIDKIRKTTDNLRAPITTFSRVLNKEMERPLRVTRIGRLTIIRRDAPPAPR